MLNQESEITFNKTLKVSANIIQDSDINSIVSYNIDKSYAKYFEKKYLASIILTTGSSKSIYFKNILNSSGENNTFTGKIISRDNDDDIMSLTFNGYTKTILGVNKVTFFVTQLYSPNVLWSIKDMTISNNVDLQIELNNPQLSDTNWNISLESISI